MEEPKIYSERLGAISDAQFRAVASRFDLGRFLCAEPTTSGLFGQNVFVSCAAGEFVLRGAPHWVKGPRETAWRREDRWQFTKEKFFAAQLHAQTRAPVPWPMLHDESSDIFGWPYLVMPRLPGVCYSDQGILQALSAEDRRQVAVALGTTLAEMQRLSAPFAGDFDIASIVLEPYPSGDTRHVIDETRAIAESAAKHGAMTDDDRTWIDDAATRALTVADSRTNTFVHGDYKLNNLTVMEGDDGWRVSGVFDLHTACFGDGAIDVVRQACSYVDTEPELAAAFVGSYLNHVPIENGLHALMPLYVINDRIKIWAYFTRPNPRPTWAQGKTFRDWATRYVDDLLMLVS